MTRAFSLRLRLTAIILLPLMAIALGVGFWQLNNARRTATEVFDRSLLSAALAVANDVAISGGDALSERTRDILSSTSGGQVFYHVYAPDGVIVAGYATPPVGIPRPSTEALEPTTFEAIYLGRDVRGVRLQNQTEIAGFPGIFTTTVWQDNEVRRAFVRDLVIRSLATILALITSVALIVWFGVRYGLRPLSDLEDAISRRTERELSPIARAVPVEVSGIVSTLNSLLGQVSRSMTAQSEFVANAAHQLRNPIAGVLALAEAVVKAPSPEAKTQRADDLLNAARDVADLSQKLLLLERAEAVSLTASHVPLMLSDDLPDWIDSMQETLPATVTLSLDADLDLPSVSGDPIMLREALLNLVDNACRHGGPNLTKINITAASAGNFISLSVTDNGKGIADQVMDKAMSRFVQLSETSSSGLGLSIVAAIAKSHGGQFALSNNAPGLCATLTLPAKTSG